MSRFKIINICLLIVIIGLIIAVLFKLRHKEEFHQKAILAQEIRKVLDHMMLDLRQARESTILDVPADGNWHQRISFETTGQGALEYFIKEGHLYRFNQGNTLLIADNIGGMHIRRQKNSPDIVEVQIEAKKNTSLISNLKIKVSE